MRITTNTIIDGYKNRLNASQNNLYKAMVQAESGRRFSAGYEDPNAAYREMQIQRRISNNDTYISIIKNSTDRLNQTESSMQQINDIVETANLSDVLTALSTSNDVETRQTLVTTLRSSIDSIVNIMNNKYGENYLFAGADTQNLPFEYDSETNTLTYRGIDVTHGNMNDLDALSAEKLYTNIGFGFQYGSDGNIVDSSAFNLSNPGINAFGYGTDADGDPKNIVVLMGEIANELEKENFDWSYASSLNEKLTDGLKNIVDSQSALGVQVSFLEKTQSRLEDVGIDLETELKNNSGIELAEAAMNFSYARYVYNASLQIGTNLLSNSFIDFMR